MMGWSSQAMPATPIGFVADDRASRSAAKRQKLEQYHPSERLSRLRSLFP
jgi:hypothetical protein